ncbi:hypothetical protein [Marinitoga sp. 1155]|uniref:hypothetical protein n=1 Tax=Marinitoga sp. 1155 TaxID=1428448 RepID=UPI000640CB0B|nr:hypothetical protein [Marinitoga sp. 1155]KLO23516.1 hypothetical protein X274_06410 [Marinitoga sp. 1155]
MKKKWVYTFSNFKNPKLYIIIFIVLLISFAVSFFVIKYNKNSEISRMEIDPRKSININYDNINKIEINEDLDNLKIYFNDDKFIHIRDEKDLSYKSISNKDIKDFSVYKNKSVILDRNNNVFIGDDNFNQKEKILEIKDNGPEKISKNIYQYNDKILVFDGNIYSYDAIKNYWTNLSKLNKLKKFDNIYFRKKYFITTTATEIYLFTVPAFNLKRILKFNENIQDVSFGENDLNENNLYILLKDKIYMYDNNKNTLTKYFEKTEFTGEKILGARYYDGDLYLLTDKGINKYNFLIRKWEFQEIEGIKKDFYIKENELYVITDKKIFSIKDKKKIFFDYDKYYSFNGNNLFFKKDRNIYMIKNGEKIKVYSGYEGTFSNINIDDIKEVHFFDNKIVLITNYSAYVYDFKVKKYTLIDSNISNIVFYFNELYYLKDKKLIKYNFIKKIEIADNVLNYDVYRQNIYYVDVYNRLFILSNGKKQELFDKNYNFDLKSLYYINKFENVLFLINEKGSININLENYKIINRENFSDDLLSFKKFDEEYVAAITRKYIYFFEKNELIKKVESKNLKLINDRGDYLTFIYKNDPYKYKFYAKDGMDFETKKIQPPFNFNSILQMFVLENKILFQLNNGNVYLLDIKNSEYIKIQVQYKNKINNIQKINGVYYCLEGDTLYEFFSKKEIQTGIKDYIYLNNQFYYLTNDNYIISSSSKKYFFNTNSVEGEFLYSYLDNYNLYVFKSKGIEKINLKDLNINVLNINIDSVFVAENKAHVIDRNNYKIVDLDELKIKKIIYIDSSNLSLNNDRFLVKEQDKIYEFKDEKKVLFDFNTRIFQNKKTSPVKKIYLYNNDLYFIGDNFYAVYSPEKLKWLYFNNVDIIDSKFINNKIYIQKTNGEISYIFDNKIVNSDIPDFTSYNNGYDNNFVSVDSTLSDIKAMFFKDKKLILLNNDYIYEYNLKTFSWKIIEKVNNIIDYYSEKESMIIFYTNKIIKYYIENEELKKKIVNRDYFKHWYSDYIFLYNNYERTYYIYDKNLDLVASREMPYYPQYIDKMYFIDNNLYLIYKNKIYGYSDKAWLFYFYDPEYYYIDDTLYVKDENNLYKIYGNNKIKILENVKDFSIVNNSYIYSDLQNNVFINNRKIIDYEIYDEIKYFYPFSEEKLLLLDNSSNVYLYNINTHSVISWKKINNSLTNYYISYDEGTKEKYLFWETNYYIYYINLSEKRFNVIKIKKELNTISTYLYNKKFYVMTETKVLVYNSNNLEKIINTEGKLPQYEYIFKYKNNIYLKTNDDTDYLVEKNLTITPVNKIITYKYLIDNNEILLKDNILVYENGEELSKPSYNELFNYDYKLSEYLFSSKSNELFNLKTFEKIKYSYSEIHNNFIRLKQGTKSILIKKNGEILSDNLPKIFFSNNEIDNKSIIKKVQIPLSQGIKMIDKLKKLKKNKEEEIKQLNKYKLENIENFNTALEIKENLIKEKTIEELINEKKYIKSRIDELNNIALSVEKNNNIIEEKIVNLKKEINKLKKKIEANNKKKLIFFYNPQKIEDNINEKMSQIDKLEDQKILNNLSISKYNKEIKKLKFQLNNIIYGLNLKYDEKIKLLELELEDINNKLYNLNSYYPDYFKDIKVYKISDKEGKSNIINLNNIDLNNIDLKYVYYKNISYEDFYNEFLEYSYEKKYFQKLQKNSLVILKEDRDIELEKSEYGTKKVHYLDNYILFENGKYFIKGVDEIQYAKNIYLYNNKILLRNKYGYVFYDGKRIFPYYTGGIIIDENGEIHYDRNINKIHFKDKEIDKLVFSNFTKQNNKLLFEGNVFIYDENKNLVSKYGVYKTTQKKVREYFDINVENKINLVPSKVYKTIELLNKKLFFDNITKVGIDGNNYYGYVPNIGIINLNNFEYIYRNNIKDLFNSNKKLYANIDDKRYLYIKGNEITKIEEKDVEKVVQKIYFNGKFKNSKSKTSAYYYFGERMSLNDFYNKIYSIFALPKDICFVNNEYIFSNQEFLYNILNPKSIKIVENKKYKNLVVINSHLVDLDKLDKKDFPYYLKKYKININIDSIKFEQKNAAYNEIFLDGNKVKKTETEKLLRVFTLGDIKYYFTRNYIFKQENGVFVKIRKINNINNIKRILNKVVFQSFNSKFMFDLQTEEIEKYNNGQLSINIDEKKMFFGNYDIKFANKYFSKSDIDFSNELYGLFKINKLIISDSANYYINGKSVILKHSNKTFNFIDIFKPAMSIDLIKNKVLINKEYILENNKLRKITLKEFINLYDLKDIIYKGSKLHVIDSNDKLFNIYYLNIVNKSNRMIFDKIYNIDKKDKNLYLISNKGIFEYNFNGKIYLEKEMIIKKSNKLINGISLYSEDSKYLFKNGKLSELKFEPKISILIDENYNIRNYISNNSKIYFEKNKKLIDITLNDYFEFIPIGNNYISIYKNNLMLFKDKVFYITFEKDIDKVFFEKNKIIVNTGNMDYEIINEDEYENYKTDEYIRYSFEILNNKLFQSETPNLYLNNDKINSLEELKPENIFVNEDYYIVNKFGIYKNGLNNIFSMSDHIYKKRINDALLIKTSNERIRFNMPDLNELNVKITYNGTEIKEKLNETFEFDFEGFSLKEIIKNEIFVFDDFNYFSIDSGNLYVSTKSGIWKNKTIPVYFYKSSLENNYIEKGKLIDKYNVSKVKVKSNLIQIDINPHLEFKEKIRENADFIIIEGMDFPFINKVFVFDIVDRIYEKDNALWTINKYGIFSDNQYFSLKNMTKTMNSHEEYLSNGEDKLYIENGKIKEYKTKKLEIKDNKWRWMLYEGKIVFINLFDSNLKRVYLNNLFQDDLIENVYINSRNLQLKDKTGYLITYENNKPINMEMYKNQKLSDFDNINYIKFSSKNYNYLFKRGKKYLYVEKIKK